ncbi:MAG: CPBP family intramembrane metalloprotease [Paludibacteraceae bacterium]|nr:CPBP family intramembrane metalloprotease [Paludibacteraceae bacterium]
MQKIFVRILVWLGIMAVLTLLAMGVWMIACGGSQSTDSLKWLQFLQTMGTFLLPPILCAWLWDENHKPFNWLNLNKGAGWQSFVLAVGIMVCAIPAINLLADLNNRIELPESLDFIEQKLKAYEASAAALTERFLKADNIGVLILNIALMALLPALAEELSFRGTLQQIISGDGLRVTGYTVHLAIWITAIVFSAIHMQFYGFIPRMLMGAAFGYVFVWSGSLWIPVVMHFTNNGIAVLAYYIFGTEDSYADTIGAGVTWWLGVISLILTSLGLLIFYRRTRKQ